MTDPKSLSELEVRFDGEAVATLTRTTRGCTFRYHDAFLASDREPIALHLPKLRSGVDTVGVANLPPYFANLLPEGIMQDAILASARLSRDDLFSQLALTAFDAIGDVTVAVPGLDRSDAVRTPREAVRRLREVLNGQVKGSFSTFSGVQPKISVGEAVASLRGQTAIIKLEPPAFPGLVENELYFNRLAGRVGLAVPHMERVDGALMTQRFDRQKTKGRQPRQVHVEDALQVLDLYPMAKYSLDYLEILDIPKQLGASKSVVLALLRLYVFAHLIGNGDLHAKNVSFVYDRSSRSWSLSPLYDLVCTLPFFEHDAYGRNMALGLDEQFGNFSRADFVAIAERYGIPEAPLARSLDQMIQTIPVFLSENPAPVGGAIVAEIESRCRALA